jgi:hypothetical protein
MSVQSTPDGHSTAPAQVGPGLTAECQACVIQLLARLASNLVTQQPVPTPPEVLPWPLGPTPRRSVPTTATDSP